MKHNGMMVLKRKAAVAAACVVFASVVWAPESLCRAQAQPSLPPGVQDVVKLAHAGMGDDVILAQVRSAGASYALNADQIIYLKDQGVSEAVIKALLPGNVPAVSTTPTATPPPVVETAASPPVDFNYFHDQLAPYGSWVEVEGYGQCWRPAAAADPNWRPYCDRGHWIYTDAGWCWQSDDTWGDIVFHYGRWYPASVGWVWVPGYDWAPAWVCWRHTEDYCGWAPLPPGAVFKAGVGLMFGGQLALDVDFGLGWSAFTFVPFDHFWDHDVHAFILPRGRADVVFRSSIVMNGYRMDHGHFIVEGLGHERVATLTHHDVRVEAPVFHDARIARRVEVETAIRHVDARSDDRKRDDSRRDSRDDRKDSRDR